MASPVRLWPLDDRFSCTQGSDEAFLRDLGLDFDARFVRDVLGGSESGSESDDDGEPAKKRNKFSHRVTPNYADTLIQRHLRDKFYEHPVHGTKRFRSRYRVPLPVYEDWKNDILEVAPSMNKLANPNARRTDHIIPLDTKLLTVLRSLGRGMSTTDDVDHSGMSPESIRAAVKEVCEITSTRLFDRYVHPPLDEAELQATMDMYSDVGCAGCMGSMDAVHLPWDRCPDGLLTTHRGRYGFATLTHNCVVGNDLFFMSATHSKPGTHNDKLLVRTDPLSLALKNGKYRDVMFTIRDQNGLELLRNDPYLIVDGGYHRWRHLICGFGRAVDPKEEAFTTRLTSVRKDVECAFGVLKRRFRILKLPLQFQKAITIDHVFRTCLVLHNMTLIADGRRFVGHSRRSDLGEWSASDVAWGRHNSTAGAEIVRRFPHGHVAYVVGANTDVTYVDSAGAADLTHHGFDPTEVAAGFEARRQELAEHFWWVKHH